MPLMLHNDNPKVGTKNIQFIIVKLLNKHELNEIYRIILLVEQLKHEFHEFLSFFF